MKIPIRLLIPVLGAVIAFPFARADEPAKLRVLADASSPDSKTESRIVIRHDDDEHEKESVAFLGVETAPVPPVLTAQLGLPKGAGLVVRHIVPDSPAAAALQRHDVLLKLDDQLLIEPRQFSVLVRNHKDGDEVTLTYIRVGKEATARVKLAKHDVPKLAFFDTPADGPENVEDFANPDDSRMHDEAMNRVLSLLDRRPDGPGPHHPSVFVQHDPGFRALTVSPDNSDMVFSDERGSLDLTIKDGKKTLVAKNAKGEQFFAGSIDTPEQRKALPIEVRERLDKLEGMQDFSFQTDGDFQGDVKVMHPATKIALPIPPRDPAEREAPPPAVF